MIPRRPLARAAALALLGAAVACADSVVRQVGPVNDPELVNVPDSLYFIASDLENVNDQFTWSWENTGTRAEVIHRAFIHHGYGILTIDDAVGTRVDSTLLEWELDASTAAGVPGTWTVTLILAGARGRAEFSLLGRP